MPGEVYTGWQTECLCTFYCSAEQKIITDGAPSSRGFPDAVMDGEAWPNQMSANRRQGAGGHWD